MPAFGKRSVDECPRICERHLELKQRLNAKNGRSLTPPVARESIFHRTREIAEVGHFDTRMQVRLYHADFASPFHDVRDQARRFAPLHAPPWHVSACVQRSPSLQAEPSALFGFEHIPVVGEHVPGSWH